MNDQEWARIVRLVVSVVAVALAMIPAALALGAATRVYHWAAGLP